MLNVTTQNFKTGIDTSVLKEVSQEILKRAAAKTGNASTQNFNSLLNKADLGLDLYNGKVDSTVARQVAMNNAGLQVQLNQNVAASIAFLNAQAAQSVHKAVEGKVTIAVNEQTAEVKTAVAPKFNSIISLATSKDKDSSNPFYHGELLNTFAKKNEESEEKMSIFA